VIQNIKEQDTTVTAVRKSRRQVRLSRALGMPLTPKAVKHFEKRPYAPGEHGRSRRRTESDYAVRMREKQRLKAQYMIREKQLVKVYENARKVAGLTGEVMVEDLETRLDALVLRAGFARTILQARQAVTHRHILVDGKIVDRPSFRVKEGQTIQVKPKSQATTPFMVAAAGAHRDVLPTVPGYLDVQLEKLSATLTRRPKRDEIPVTCEVNLVVEFYAR
jgi:small subunit ribosomal protein S4